MSGCVWWCLVVSGGVGSHTQYHITPVQDLELELKTGTGLLQHYILEVYIGFIKQCKGYNDTLQNAGFTKIGQTDKALQTWFEGQLQTRRV